MFYALEKFCEKQNIFFHQTESVSGRYDGLQTPLSNRPDPPLSFSSYRRENPLVVVGVSDKSYRNAERSGGGERGGVAGRPRSFQSAAEKSPSMIR